MRVDAHARTGGQVEARQRAAGRPRVALRIERLGVDAPLHREPAAAARAARIEAKSAQGLPGSDADLQLHQVEAGDRLGHRVLDLQARIGLDEDEGQRRLERSSTRNSNVPRPR